MDFRNYGTVPAQTFLGPNSDRFGRHLGNDDLLALLIEQWRNYQSTTRSLSDEVVDMWTHFDHCDQSPRCGERHRLAKVQLDALSDELYRQSGDTLPPNAEATLRARLAAWLEQDRSR